MKPMWQYNPYMRTSESAPEEEWDIQAMSEYADTFDSKVAIVEHIEKVEKISRTNHPEKFLERYENYCLFNPNAKLCNHHQKD